MTHKVEKPPTFFIGPVQAVQVNEVDASSSQNMCSQVDPVVWLNVKEEPEDADNPSSSTMFNDINHVQQNIESMQDIQIPVKM